MSPPDRYPAELLKNKLDRKPHNERTCRASSNTCSKDSSTLMTCTTNSRRSARRALRPRERRQGKEERKRRGELDLRELVRAEFVGECLWRGLGRQRCLDGRRDHPRDCDLTHR